MNDHRVTTFRLILFPALITLAVTLLRLAGELGHLSKMFFNSDAGGSWAIVGITWLAPVFGIFFAVRLVRQGEGPASLGRALGIAVLGCAALIISMQFGPRVYVAYGLKINLIFFWTVWALAGLLQWAGWPRLFKVLAAYGYAARIPVAVLMFFAFWGHWGTHYDAVPKGWVSNGLLSDYLWMGFFAQLALWVGYTIVAGAIFGSLTAGVMRLAGRVEKASAA